MHFLKNMKFSIWSRFNIDKVGFYRIAVSFGFEQSCQSNIKKTGSIKSHFFDVSWLGPKSLIIMSLELIITLVLNQKDHMLCN